MHLLTQIGLLLNTGLIIFNRFVMDLGAFSVPAHLIAVSMMVACIVLTASI